MEGFLVDDELFDGGKKVIIKETLFDNEQNPKSNYYNVDYLYYNQHVWSNRQIKKTNRKFKIGKVNSFISPQKNSQKKSTLSILFS